MCNRFAKVCTDFSMTINLKKTGVMSRGTPNPPRILINGSLLTVVDNLFYLGSVVNSSNSLDNEISKRVAKASTNFGRLSSRVWNRHLTIKPKVRAYSACILNILLRQSLWHSDTLCLNWSVIMALCFHLFWIHWQLVSLFRDGSLYCFCLLPESYETINQ